MRRALITMCFLILSCTHEAPGNSLSELGFYSSPDEAIARLGKGAQSPAEHFMLGQAYRQKKEYRLSVRHFANSCFSSHRDPRLRHYPSLVHRFVTGFHFKSKFYSDALFEIAHLYQLYREHEWVVTFVNLIPGDRSAMYRDAVILKSLSLSSLKRHDEALSCLRGILDDFRDPGSKALIHLRTASICEQTEKNGEALKEYARAVSQDETSW